MNIEELRTTRKRLQRSINYCPPAGASDRQWENAQQCALTAAAELEPLRPTFALLDEIDRLAARVEWLEQHIGKGKDEP